MLISEMELKLKELKEKHGDLPILLADRYNHFEIKWIDYSSVSTGRHICVRMMDNIKYD